MKIPLLRLPSIDSKLLRVAPLILMLILSMALAMGLFSGPAFQPPYSMLNMTIPNFELPILGKADARMTPPQWRRQVVVLNVFASWCAPCAAEHETLMRLAQMRKVAIYGIAWKDKDANVAAYLRQHGNPYQAIGDDPRGDVTIPLALTGVPETFVIDQEGIIRYHLGAQLTDDIVTNKLLPLVEKLRGEK